MIRKPPKGFTLIELMVTVMIVAILAAVAYPSFMDSVRKSRRSDAKRALTELQMAQEKFRANCLAYARSLTASSVKCGDLNLDGDDTDTGENSALTYALQWSGTGGSNDRSPDGFYTITLSGVSTTDYTVTATPVSGTSQASDTRCTTLILAVTSAGETKTATPAANAADCWR